LANHASALKRAKQSEKRRLQNKAVRTHMRNVIKSVRQVIAQGQATEAEAALDRKSVV
jgi:small subunit ribosomal protein S20